MWDPEINELNPSSDPETGVSALELAQVTNQDIASVFIPFEQCASS
jgi:hypothetical protein